MQSRYALVRVRVFYFPNGARQVRPRLVEAVKRFNLIRVRPSQRVLRLHNFDIGGDSRLRIGAVPEPLRRWPVAVPGLQPLPRSEPTPVLQSPTLLRARFALRVPVSSPQLLSSPNPLPPPPPGFYLP